MATINYSIIIPHYNIPHLLDRCLQSIPVREDVQVIVVDDCSEEVHLKQVKELEKEHSTVHFVYSPINGGGGKARNIGMSYAKGKFLIFADADDFFFDGFSEVLDKYKNSPEDILYFRNYNVLSDNCNIFIDHTKWIDDILDRHIQTQDFGEITCRIFNPWAKFYKKNFIDEHNIHFDETPVSNDVFFVVSAACSARSRRVFPEVIYFYTERKDSTTASYAKRTEELSIRMEVCFRAQKVMKHYGYKINSMPMSYFMFRAYRSDISLYREYLKKTPEIYDSLWDALFQIRCFIYDYKEKLELYTRSILWWLKELIKSEKFIFSI